MQDSQLILKDFPGTFWSSMTHEVSTSLLPASTHQVSVIISSNTERPQCADIRSMLGEALLTCSSFLGLASGS